MTIFKFSKRRQKERKRRKSRGKKQTTEAKQTNKKKTVKRRVTGVPWHFESSDPGNVNIEFSAKDRSRNVY